MYRAMCLFDQSQSVGIDTSVDSVRVLQPLAILRFLTLDEGADQILMGRQPVAAGGAILEGWW